MGTRSDGASGSLIRQRGGQRKRQVKDTRQDPAMACRVGTRGDGTSGSLIRQRRPAKEISKRTQDQTQQWQVNT